MFASLTTACPEMTALAGLVHSFAALLKPISSNTQRLVDQPTSIGALPVAEERAFQLLVTALGWVLAADAGPGAAGDRGEAGVGGQVAGGRERGDVTDFEQGGGLGG
jgi:hypothetical protein